MKLTDNELKEFIWINNFYNEEKLHNFLFNFEKLSFYNDEKIN